MDCPIVLLAEPMPEEGLLEGTMGIIVYLYEDGLNCEVEFADITTCKILTVPLYKLKPFNSDHNL